MHLREYLATVHCTYHSVRIQTSTPDFSRAQSDDNSLLLGDDEQQWDREAQLVLTRAHDQELEDISDAASMDADSPPVEVLEFDQILEEAMAVVKDDGGEAEYVNVPISMRCMVAELKVIARDLNLSVTGNKATLFACIRDCSSKFLLRGESDDSFEYQKVREMAQENGPY